MSGRIGLDTSQGILLQGTSALNCAAGIIGGASGGSAYDTELLGVYIMLGGTAATLTIGGFKDNTGAAANLIVSGQVATDVEWVPVEPVLNYFGAFTFTPSAAARVMVFVRAYVGPERPGPRGTT